MKAQRIGRYDLFDVLARGGMATVHLGSLRGPAGFSRIVAIKRMLPQYASSPDFVAMFLEEARLAGRVRHPNVVPVIDVVAEDGEVLLVMELVKGETVSAIVREHRIPPEIACAIACDMLDGLHAAHEARDDDGKPLGIVHRDVSPQNVMVGVDGVARVLDFGIAKAAGRAQVTREGQLKGKVAYMAPEQLQGKATRSSDVFAAGVVLWEMLAGKRLFDRETEAETMHAVLHDAIERPGVAVYDDVVMRALARSPDERFATAREMSLALAKCPRAEPHEVGAWLEANAKNELASRAALTAEVETAITERGEGDGPPAPRPRWPVYAGAVLLGAVTLGAVWIVTRPPPVTLAQPPLPTPSFTAPIATSTPFELPATSPTPTASSTPPLPRPPVTNTRRLPVPSVSASVRIPEFL